MRKLGFNGVLLAIHLILIHHVSLESAVPDPIPLPGVKWPVAIAEEYFNFPSNFPGAARMFYIKGAAGVPLSKMVDLTIFGSFRPGMTIAEAAERFGRPSATRSNKSDTVAVYDLPTVRIEVEDHIYNTIFTAHRRTVYAYPKPSSAGCKTASSIFDPSVTSFIPTKGAAVELHVAEAGDAGQHVFVLVRGGCVEAINWVKHG